MNKNNSSSGTTGKLIDLTSDDFPECETCNEPTKRVTGKSFDLDGPGQVGTTYWCKNRACQALRVMKLRAWALEVDKFFI